TSEATVLKFEEPGLGRARLFAGIFCFGNSAASRMGSGASQATSTAEQEFRTASQKEGQLTLQSSGTLYTVRSGLRNGNGNGHHRPEPSPIWGRDLAHSHRDASERAGIAA